MGLSPKSLVKQANPFKHHAAISTCDKYIFCGDLSFRSVPIQFNLILISFPTVVNKAWLPHASSTKTCSTSIRYAAWMRECRGAENHIGWSVSRLKSPSSVLRKPIFTAGTRDLTIDREALLQSISTCCIHVDAIKAFFLRSPESHWRERYSIRKM